MVAQLSETDAAEDQRVVLHDMGWAAYEAMLELRGHRPGIRIYYLDGAIELVSTSRIHEDRKTTLARLLELWSLERDIEVHGLGSWTLKRQVREAGAEPDECYVRGVAKDHEVPDLAIEVEWSRTLGLVKHEIYRRLGVGELWTLRNNGTLVVRVLEHDAWIELPTSRLFPELDLPWLLSFLALPQPKAVVALRDALRASR